MNISFGLQAGNIGLILGSAAFPSLLQYGWRAPFVLSGVIGVVTALVIYITVPNVTIADEVVSKSSTPNIVKHSVDENGVLAKLKVLLSIPLCLAKKVIAACGARNFKAVFIFF